MPEPLNPSERVQLQSSNGQRGNRQLEFVDARLILVCLKTLLRTASALAFFERYSSWAVAGKCKNNAQNISPLCPFKGEPKPSSTGLVIRASISATGPRAKDKAQKTLRQRPFEEGLQIDLDKSSVHKR